MHARGNCVFSTFFTSTFTLFVFSIVRKNTGQRIFATARLLLNSAHLNPFSAHLTILTFMQPLCFTRFVTKLKSRKAFFLSRSSLISFQQFKQTLYLSPVTELYERISCPLQQNLIRNDVQQTPLLPIIFQVTS